MLGSNGPSSDDDRGRLSPQMTDRRSPPDGSGGLLSLVLPTRNPTDPPLSACQQWRAFRGNGMGNGLESVGGALPNLGACGGSGGPLAGAPGKHAMGQNLEVIRSGKYNSGGRQSRGVSGGWDVEMAASRASIRELSGDGRPDMLIWCWARCSHMTWSAYIVCTGGVCAAIICLAEVAGALIWAEPATAVHLRGPNGPTSPTSGLDDDAFELYVAITLWLVLVVSGLGSEAILGEWLVVNLDGGSSGSGIALWHAAQLFFALCVSVAIFSQSPFGFPFVVAGLWKFGFPETTLCFMFAFIEGRPTLVAVREYINGVGTVLHHGAVCWIVVVLTLQLIPLNRQTQALCLPLLLQHVVVLTKYHSVGLYVFLEIILEIAWEWEILAQQGNLTAERGFHRYAGVHGLCLTMLIAHWLYWTAGALSVAPDVYNKLCKVRAHSPADQSGMPMGERARANTLHGWRDGIAEVSKHRGSSQISSPAMSPRGPRRSSVTSSPLTTVDSSRELLTGAPASRSDGRETSEGSMLSMATQGSVARFRGSLESGVASLSCIGERSHEGDPSNRMGRAGGATSFGGAIVEDDPRLRGEDVKNV